LQAAARIAAGLSATPLTDTAVQLALRARLGIGHVPAGAQPSPHDGERSTRFGLTPRELDVLRLVSKGMSNRRLAAELFISANTAGVHVSRILTKLGVASRTEAAAFAHQHELLGQASPDTGLAALSRRARPRAPGPPVLWRNAGNRRGAAARAR
jgi:DNA-binding NarL/FixJ family response regulator